MSKPKPTKPKAKGTCFSRYFKHWRSGQVLDAHAYGHKAWPIGKAK